LGYRLSGREQLATLSFADALETIPASLAQNAGMNALDVLLELRTKHAAGAAWHGVDSAQRTITDMRPVPVYEPLSIKLRVLQVAYEVAALLTRTGAYMIKRQVTSKRERLLAERKKYLDPARVKKIHKEHYAELA
jgi:chaperonin GroEL (HSP60 family)